MIPLKKLLSEACAGIDKYGKSCSGGINGDWAGSQPRCEEIAAMTGLKFGSQKRSREETASGNRSDHWIESIESYGIDLPVAGVKGDEAWKRMRNRIVELRWIPVYKMPDSLLEPGKGQWINFIKDGYRYQIGWNVKGHYDHIHIGVRKIKVTDMDKSNLQDEPVTNDIDVELDNLDSDISTKSAEFLALGDKGDQVKDLQQRLIYILKDPLVVGPAQDDGEFGIYTEKGIIAFQTMYGINETGIFDKQTQEKLMSLTKDVSAAELANVPSPHSEEDGHLIVPDNIDTNSGYVLFITGLTSDISKRRQIKQFQSKYTDNKPVKIYSYQSINLIRDFVRNNPIDVVVLYSKSCELLLPKTRHVLPSDIRKIYLIEPWNGNLQMAKYYKDVPSRNMYLHPTKYKRGAKIRQSGFKSTRKYNHLEALGIAVQNIFNTKE